MTRPVSHFSGVMTGGCSRHEAGQRGAFDGLEEALGISPASEAAKEDGDGLFCRSAGQDEIQ